MSDSMTDVELVGEFSKRAESSYRSGVEFILTNPIFSLREFRVSLECLCHDLAFNAGVRSDGESLHDAIEVLANKGVVTFFVKDAFHQARMLCNDAVHSPVWRKGDGRSRIVVSASENERRANKVRELLIKALKNIREKQGRGGVDVTHAVIDAQRWKNLLYDAFMPSSAVGKSPLEKCKAAEYLETLVEKELADHPEPIISLDVEGRTFFYKKAAAILYEAAYRENPENMDAAFRYASMVDDGVVVETRKGEVKEIFESLVKQGSVEAFERYAYVLYDEKNYVGAKKHLVGALDRGGVNAAHGLALYYSNDDTGEKDYREAIRYLEIGVSQGDPRCMSFLGEVLYEGEWGVVNKPKGKMLLERAASLGDRSAEFYLKMKVNMTKKIWKQVSRKAAMDVLFDLGMNPTNIQRKGKKIPPNSPCTCGSGKKYKKCCGAS